ncbi:hypothetical protein [Microbacterium sp. 22242]|uniref:hypothetical protein n=1 Tax=Microbacterium sp. 22242 TaxID=3453896 RepID=UPI003F841FB4
MTEHRVVILGEARVDEIRDAHGMRETVTGDAVELANALLGHGLDLTVVSPAGEDADGERIRAALQDRGIRLVPVPTAEGTPRRRVVGDSVSEAGSEAERRRSEPAFADTRRSLAAQAEADVIVDLRDREVATVEEDRDEVLRALGLSGAAAPEQSVLDEGDAAEERHGARQPQTGTTRGQASVTATPGADGPGASAPLLLPAPIVAGTYRHSPVRLLPDPPTAHAAAPDWFGLEERLARIAT